jgi:transcriptional regulator with XRE-family HTH domain
VNYGEKVKHIRKRNGVTTSELGKYLEVSQSMISQVERGVTRFSDDKALKMAKYFNMPIDFFLNDDYVSLDEFEVDTKTKKLLNDSNLVDYIVLADKAKKENISIKELEDAINFIISIKRNREAD